MAFTIEVENKFEMSRRNLQVRRKSLTGTLEEQRASCISSGYGVVEGESRLVSCSLGPVEGEQEYLEISMDNQQDELGPCKIDIWSNGPVTFVPPTAASITVIPLEDVETYTSLRIPSGYPTWKLEIMRPPQSSSEEGDPVVGLIPRDEGSMVNVKVGDDPPGGWD